MSVLCFYRFKTESGFLAVCSEAKGLTDLAHDVAKDEVKIEPFTPGHVQSYSLDSYGMATFISESKFHSVGAPPRYDTLVTEYG